MCKFIANGFLIQTMYFELLLSQQKLGTFFENKVLQKLKFSKKCPLKLIFFYDFFLERFEKFS